MEYLADLHIHSKYARATSKRNIVPIIAEWAAKKGINIIGTGDFTHPKWLNELKNSLKENGNGFYKYENTQFVLSTEFCTNYHETGKYRKVHHCILSPSFDIVDQIIDEFHKDANFSDDGRPLLKITAPNLVERLKSISDKIEIFPAHIWTPWFGMLGSKSGFDSFEACYKDQLKQIYAFETGLSSDPAMNWRLKSLDKYSILSCSDMHSPENIGREATVFEFKKPSYDAMIKAIRNHNVKRTLEFYPQEGKYYYDGHRKCNVRLSPKESKKYGAKCPECAKNLTLGVLHRVESLADRPEGEKPDNAVPYESLIPLRDILTQSFGMNKYAKTIKDEYNRLVQYFGNEYKVLHADKESLTMATRPVIADAIVKARFGDVTINPGYDGVYGEVIINSKKKDKKLKTKRTKKTPSLTSQQSLMDY